MDTIDKIKEVLEEYADCRQELDLDKCAAEIYKLVEASLPHYAEPAWHHNQNILGKGVKK